MIYKVIHQSTDTEEIETLSALLIRKGIIPRTTLDDSVHSLYLPLYQFDRFIKYIPEMKKALGQE